MNPGLTSQHVLSRFITTEDVLKSDTKRGFAAVSQARAVTWWVYGQLTGKQSPEIASDFGHDASTVRYALKQLSAKPALKKRAEHILHSMKREVQT